MRVTKLSGLTRWLFLSVERRRLNCTSTGEGEEEGASTVNGVYDSIVCVADSSATRDNREAALRSVTLSGVKGFASLKT